MPNLKSGEDKKLDLSASRKRKIKAAEEDSEKLEIKKSSTSRVLTDTASSMQSARHRIMQSDRLLEDDEDDDDEDEIIQESLKTDSKKGISPVMMTLVGVILVLVIIVGFVVLRNTFSREEDPIPSSPPQIESTDPGPTGPDSPGIGTQDFTGDTNMTSNSVLTDPDNFVKDLYGLTLQTDYTVSAIQSAADLVNYKKCRGTWGGGIELYYLDVIYRDTKYVIQVPFKYYKELDDEGIVPVKMEVLRIKSATSDDYLSVISYMTLDEDTLKSILKAQAR